MTVRAGGAAVPGVGKFKRLEAGGGAEERVVGGGTWVPVPSTRLIPAALLRFAVASLSILRMS